MSLSITIKALLREVNAKTTCVVRTPVTKVFATVATSEAFHFITELCNSREFLAERGFGVGLEQVYDVDQSTISTVVTFFIVTLPSMSNAMLRGESWFMLRDNETGAFTPTMMTTSRNGIIVFTDVFTNSSEFRNMEDFRQNWESTRCEGLTGQVLVKDEYASGTLSVEHFSDIWALKFNNSIRNIVINGV